jgi:hypothetical protein
MHHSDLVLLGCILVWLIAVEVYVLVAVWLILTSGLKMIFDLKNRSLKSQLRNWWPPNLLRAHEEVAPSSTLRARYKRGLVLEAIGLAAGAVGAFALYAFLNLPVS